MSSTISYRRSQAAPWQKKKSLWQGRFMKRAWSVRTYLWISWPTPAATDGSVMNVSSIWRSAPSAEANSNWHPHLDVRGNYETKRVYNRTDSWRVLGMQGQGCGDLDLPMRPQMVLQWLFPLFEEVPLCRSQFKGGILIKMWDEMQGPQTVSWTKNVIWDEDTKRQKIPKILQIKKIL